MSKQQYQTTEEYIASFPENIQVKLNDLRNLIKQEAPKAKEKISYQMPCFFVNKNCVWFAAYSKHIGFYPTSKGIKAFESELSSYKYSKGAIQFPLEKPLPTELIKRIVHFMLATTD